MGSGASTAADDQINGAVEFMLEILSSGDRTTDDNILAPPVTSWTTAFVEIIDRVIIVREMQAVDAVKHVEITLDSQTEVESGHRLADDTFVVAVHRANKRLLIKAMSRDDGELKAKILHKEIMASVLLGFHNCPVEDHIEHQGAAAVPHLHSLDCSLGIKIPKMNIVILVVGTRGDVQPFVYLGQGLQKDGHRVRLATHAEYRDDVVAKGGLEFYPLGGDPRKLSEFMVKTKGRLIPDLTSAEERQALPEKMKMLREITFSTHGACTDEDPGDPDHKPFTAHAIISNPVSYGHIHCAEALGIPLHIMFPQPWYPTMAFPHPLSNLSLDSQWSSKNYYSYKMVEDLFWLGLGGIINDFRTQVLDLSSIRHAEGASSLLKDNRIPISHMWSPSFVPKAQDWPEHVDVVGEFRSLTGPPSSFVPPGPLTDFLAAGEKPIYIGFGSMVIGDAKKLVSMITEAAAAVGCRILLQSGWTKYAEDNSLLSKDVMVIGAMPHDWLLYQVSGVVHHGGAGTTSAGLRAGNPTFICPFFGDQHFWAEMVYRAGVGPKGCPIVDLTLEKLMAALKLMRDQETIEKATALGAKMNAEDGVRRGIESFNHNLPLANMLCEVSLFDQQSSRIATTFCADCGLKMCVEVDQILHRPGSSRVGHKRAPFRPARYGVVDPLSSIGNLLTRRRLSREALMKHGHSKRIERDLIAQPHPASASASSLSAGEVSRRTGDTEASPESVANIEAVRNLRHLQCYFHF